MMAVSVRLIDLVCPGSRLAVLNTNREIHRIAWRWQAQNFGRQRYQDGGARRDGLLLLLWLVTTME